MKLLTFLLCSDHLNVKSVSSRTFHGIEILSLVHIAATGKEQDQQDSKNDKHPIDVPCLPPEVRQVQNSVDHKAGQEKPADLGVFLLFKQFLELLVGLFPPKNDKKKSVLSWFSPISSAQWAHLSVGISDLSNKNVNNL